MPDTDTASLRYERLLKQLHELIADGRIDSDEADAVRDAMGEPWAELTPLERERAPEFVRRD